MTYQFQTNAALQLIATLCKNGGSFNDYLDFDIEELAHLAFHKELVSIPSY